MVQAAGDLHVVATGCDANKGQLLIVIDLPLIVIHTLVWPLVFGSGGRQLQFDDGLAGSVQKARTLDVVGHGGGVRER